MARLPRGVKRREDGLLEKTFTLYGQEFTICADSVRELAEAEIEVHRQHLIGMESPRQRNDISLDGYFEIWLSRKASVDKEVTAYRYRLQYEGNISPALGKTSLCDITQSNVFFLQQKLAGDLHPKTVNYLIRLLRSILDDAVMEELLQVNPAAGLRSMKNTEVPATKRHHQALTEEEQRLFMQRARDNFYYEFFALLLLTGMRYGEAAALVWADLDEKEHVIHVTKSLSFSREGHVVTGPTKTRSGVRDIPLTEMILSILDMQRQKMRTRFGEDAILPDAAVFRSTNGIVVHNRTANLNLQQILRELEEAGTPIEHFTLHALRDTFATRFIEQGGNPQTLKALLGHSHLHVTMDLYSQVLPKTKQREMEALRIEI